MGALVVMVDTQKMLIEKGLTPYVETQVERYGDDYIVLKSQNNE